MKSYQVILFFFISISCSSCLFDGGSKREIVNGYYLHQWEGGTPYYIVKRWSDPDGGGILEGTIKELSWNEEYIFAKRKSTFGGDVSGWMIIDVNEQEVKGPFTDGEFAIKQKELIGNQAMEKYLPEKAWNILK